MIKFHFLIAGILGSFVILKGQPVVNAHEMEHHHSMLEVPEGKPVPSVDLIVHPDSKQGWNLEIRVSNFKFAPGKVNQSGSYDEGHAHLYINGKKVTRIYGNWYYLSELPSGKHEIKIELNGNGHELLMYQGKQVEDVEVIEVP